ncbi:ABC-2 type transport system permease protein [Anaerosporobacter mobilis DSM 15930]|uniref:ABC-2 type transport system permease protein n=1 Tax=Anaerosporobacter mobilis DSM 15930 TaxID=1120996 RepID=A0A1M7JKJ0_9FIRM|nr:ABC-2 family transporter protein [Anaerosporobacter mobilis]SHM53524.1 ABC-2 type transport system permease protein [Anaerosporobacter mobilis DSM 15930]
MRRYFHLYRVFATQFMKSLVQSKVDFIIGLLGFFLSQMFGIVFLSLVFKQIPSLNGWTFEQLVFIYGFAQIPRGIDHFLTDNIWMLAMRYVIRGEFDRFLLRPINPFFQLICDKFQADAVGELIVGFALVVFSVVNHTVTVTPVNVLLFMISVFAGALIYTSIKLFFASLAFWIKDSIAILQLAYETADFAKYPLSIYPKGIRFILTYLIPFAFVAFFPASYFLTGENVIMTIGAEVLIAGIVWIIAYAVFRKGLTVYESAGN